MKISRMERLIEVSIYTNLFHADFPHLSGWWATAAGGIKSPGSHLYTYSREKITAETLKSINRATAASLEWLTTGKYAEAVKTDSRRLKNGIEIMVWVDGRSYKNFLPLGASQND